MESFLIKQYMVAIKNMPSALPKRRFVDEKGTTIITEGHSPIVLDVCYQNRTNYFLTVLKYTSKIFFFMYYALHV